MAESLDVGMHSRHVSNEEDFKYFIDFTFCAFYVLCKTHSERVPNDNRPTTWDTMVFRT